jgi:hypothetical protein
MLLAYVVVVFIKAMNVKEVAYELGTTIYQQLNNKDANTGFPLTESQGIFLGQGKSGILTEGQGKLVIF